MLMVDNHCATKCYVLFVELITNEGVEAILSEQCKSKVCACSKVK